MSSIRITVSIGVCKEAKNFSECFKKADQALYKAKNNGRNMVIIYEENN